MPPTYFPTSSQTTTSWYDTNKLCLILSAREKESLLVKRAFEKKKAVASPSTQIITVNRHIREHNSNGQPLDILLPDFIIKNVWGTRDGSAVKNAYLPFLPRTWAQS